MNDAPNFWSLDRFLGDFMEKLSNIEKKEIVSLIKNIIKGMMAISNIIERELMLNHYDDGQKLSELLDIAYCIDSGYVRYERYKGRTSYCFEISDLEKEKIRLRNNIGCLEEELRLNQQSEIQIRK